MDSFYVLQPWTFEQNVMSKNIFPEATSREMSKSRIVHLNLAKNTDAVS